MVFFQLHSVSEAAASVAGTTNEIWVSRGSYGNATIVIDETTSIYGGFTGVETNRAIFTGNRLWRVITANSNMLLDGLVVSNGGGNAGAAGLGIYMSGNYTAEVYNCLIVSNYANVTGGGDGPGVHLVNGTAIFTNCVFDNNGSGAGSGGSDNGGAVFIDSGIVSISNCTFAGNSCSGEGGAIAMDGVVVSISDCIFYTNEAPIRADSISVLGGTAFINYARMDGTNVTDDVYDAVAGLAISNVIFDAPSFASDSHYHLMSRAARWTPLCRHG